MEKALVIEYLELHAQAADRETRMKELRALLLPALREGETAPATASRLVNKSEVRARISELSVKFCEVATLSAARVLEEIKTLALVDMRGFFDEAGNLKPVHLLTPEQGACLAGFEVIKKNA